MTTPVASPAWTSLPDEHLDAAGVDLREPGGLVVRDERGGLAGHARWAWRQWGPDTASRVVQVELWLRPEHLGRGLETLVLRELAELFFDRTAVHRLETVTEVDDVAAHRSLVAAGFVREGLVRGVRWRAGVPLDGVLHATLRTDPR